MTANGATENKILPVGQLERIVILRSPGDEEPTDPLQIEPLPEFSAITHEALVNLSRGNLPQRHQHLGRSNHLPHMPLRMIRHMNQRPAQASRQLPATNPANRLKVGSSQHPHPLRRI